MGSSIRYIGSKARVVDELLQIIGSPGAEDGTFVDAFCGTGVVAAKAADLGWKVRLNDNLHGAVAVSTARLLSAEAAPLEKLGGYALAVEELNATDPVFGFIWREYSPGGPLGRRYFSPENAARIDGVRARLKEWDRAGMLSADERRLLLADLIAGAGRVANIAGTYGCYLNHWSPAALQAFTITPRQLREVPVHHSAYCGDVVDTPMAENDVAYFDPPYTKRQYAAYYHLNETLARGDEPELSGKTGLRPWRDKASEYCYKGRALGALENLIHNAPASRVYLSYSSEGHVSLGDLRAALEPLGDLSVHELGAVGRYRPNRTASRAGSEVTEYLIQLERTPVTADVLA